MSFRDSEAYSFKTRVHRSPRDKLSNWVVERIEHLTVIIEREDAGYVGLCPEFDVVSHLDRLVDGQALADGIGEGSGWTSNLEHFAKAVVFHRRYFESARCDEEREVASGACRVRK